MTAVRAWLEDRLALGGLFSRLVDGRVELKGAWLKTTGLTCLVLILVECVTGIVLSQFYTPSPAAAFKNVQAINADPVGRFVRGVHHWGSAALILLALLSVIRMFFSAEYKKRYDLVWICTLIFLQLVLFFQLTGHILPWDTNATTTASVEAGFAGNVWVLGPLLKRAILGGSAVGSNTLIRWYGIHVIVLPAALLLLAAIPLCAYRLRASRREEEAADTAETPGSEEYYPNHMAREMMAALAVFLIVAFLAFRRGAPLELEATAANLGGDYQSLAEWYVLPLHALTLLPPFNKAAIEPLGTVILPALLILVLLVLPFIDRNPSRKLSSRPFALTMGLLTLFTTAGLYGYAFVKERTMAVKQAERIALMTGEKQPELNAQLVATGKKLYEDQGCSGCHSIKGNGGNAGPQLTLEGRQRPEKDWQMEHLIKPASKVPGSTMPAYAQLSKEQIAALAEYMVSLR